MFRLFRKKSAPTATTPVERAVEDQAMSVSERLTLIAELTEDYPGHGLAVQVCKNGEVLGSLTWEDLAMAASEIRAYERAYLYA